MTPAVNSFFSSLSSVALILSCPAGEGNVVAASTSSAGSEGSSVESPTASTVGGVSHVDPHHLNYTDTGSGLNDTRSLSDDTPLEEKKNGSVTTTPGKESGNAADFGMFLSSQQQLGDLILVW